MIYSGKLGDEVVSINKDTKHQEEIIKKKDMVIEDLRKRIEKLSEVEAAADKYIEKNHKLKNARDELRGDNHKVTEVVLVMF